MELLNMIITLLSVGGVLYLIIDKKVLSKREKTEIQQLEQDIKKDVLTNGVEAISFYKEVKALIKEETDPLNDKIDMLSHQLDKYCCYKNDCKLRVRYPEDSNNG